MRRLSVSTVAVLLIGAFILGGVAFGGLEVFDPTPREASADPAFSDEEADALFERLKRSLDIMSRRSLAEVDRDVLIEGAIRGALLTLGDPYADYIDEERFSQMMDRYYQPTYAGIGVRVTAAPAGPLILDVFRHGPADRAGIEPGDIIYRVGDVDVSEMDLSDTVDLIRGEEGTEVTISVIRGEERIDDITIEREEIAQPTLEFDTLTIHGNAIGYITIREFSDTTPKEMERALEALSGVEGLVVDVRGNPGGVLSSAVDTAAKLVPPGKILETHGRDEVLAAFRDDSPGVTMPLTVLVDGGTASGAEILAGVARERGGALLVGEESYGKGMVQSIYDIDGYGLRLTTAEYLLPSGYAIADRGLEPDIFVTRGGRVEPSPRFATFDRALKQGDHGPDVESLNARLQTLGYYHGEVDDAFGPMTTRAVLAFQTEEGLPTSGEVDVRTLGRILDRTGYVDSPLRYGALEEDEVEVDNPAFRLDRQLLASLGIHLGQLGLEHPNPNEAPAAD